MSVASDTHTAYPVLLGLPNGNPHGASGSNVAQAVVAVVQTDRASIHHQPAVRLCVHAARAEALDVARRKPGPVGVYPTQVGVGEDVPHELGVLVADTGCAEELGYQLLQAARIHSSVVTGIAHALLSP